MGAVDNQRWPVQIFPLLVALEEGDVCIYEGFLTLESLPTPPNLWLRLSFPGANNPNGPRSIQCSRELQQLLGSSTSTVQKRLHSSFTLTSFLLELRDLLERAVMVRLPSQPPLLDYHPQLFDELDAIGWDRIVALQPDLSRVCFSAMDGADRQHTLTVFMGADYPRKQPTVEADLPVELDLKWTSSCGLRHVVQQWEQALYHWQDLWACLTDLDNNTWVLEPSPPKWSDTKRRIALGGHVTMTVELHLEHPRLCPEVRFLGPRNKVEELDLAWGTNVHLWEDDRPMHLNLETLLGMSLPQRDESQLDDNDGHCCICYQFKNGTVSDSNGAEETPDVHCHKCGHPFHRSCLVQWLISLPKSTTSNYHVIGDCFYCNTTLFIDTR